MSDVESDYPTGTAKYYTEGNPRTGSKKGRVNLNNDIAKYVDYGPHEELVVMWNQETRELCLKPKPKQPPLKYPK